MDKMDRRAKRTIKCLKDALAKLLMNKELRNISVRELTDLADISRGAFYKHFDDIYDLYEKMENELFDELSNIMVKDPTHLYYENYKNILDYVQNNAAVCRTFICRNENGSFRNKLTDLFQDRYNQIVLYEMGANEAKEEWMYLERYHNAGFLEVIRMWLESDFAFPKKKLLKLVIDIDEKCDSLYE